jgi:hypothetical protein
LWCLPNCTMHCPNCTIHCPNCTMHCPNCTMHCPNCTIHCPNCTMHCPNCTMHCPNCTMHCPNCTVHCPNCTMHCCPKCAGPQAQAMAVTFTEYSAAFQTVHRTVQTVQALARGSAAAQSAFSIGHFQSQLRAPFSAVRIYREIYSYLCLYCRAAQ